jgi:hypothetical protein
MNAVDIALLPPSWDGSQAMRFENASPQQRLRASNVQGTVQGRTRSKPMNEISIRTLAKLVLVLALPVGVAAQATQAAGTLNIAGLPDQAALVRINGKAYVDVESLARITHGSIKFQGNQTILTLPAAGAAADTGTQVSAQPVRPHLSETYLAAQVGATSAIREWRAALVQAVEKNAPVTADWTGKLRRTAENQVQLAVAAATTDQDQHAVNLLRNEFDNLEQLNDQFLALHTKDNYVSPDSFSNNPLDAKIVGCEQALTAMSGSKQFQDDPACH